jgi:tRNA dimethylallyltransferase
VGKTALLEQLFAQGYEVVNADSKQIYRHLDIGSAKPEGELMSRIPHHLIDIKDPWEQFSVGEFVNLADHACASIEEKGKVPIICGGTAYYFKHFYFGLPESPKSDPEIRTRIAQLASDRGLAWCHKHLSEIDPVSASRIHPSDGYRITRALEVYESSGRPLSSYHVPTKAREDLDPVIIGLQRDRSELDERITARVQQMFSQGLEAEFEKLLAMGAQPDWPGMQGIGYREFFIGAEHPSMDREAIAHLIVRNSRLYAKRQMTFFKSLPGVHWVHPDNLDAIRKLIDSQ